MPKNGKVRPVLIKLAFAAGFVILMLVAISVAKQTYKKNQIQKMIDELNSQAEKIDRDKINITDRISYLGSSEYQKKELKDKFNLQEPGEEVVVIKPGPAEEESAKEETLKNLPREETKIPNPVKWWNYFFKY